MHRLQTCIRLELLIVYALVYYLGFFNKRLIFYDLFCEEPSDLLIYASTAARRSIENTTHTDIHRYIYGCMQGGEVGDASLSFQINDIHNHT